MSENPMAPAEAGDVAPAVTPEAATTDNAIHAVDSTPSLESMLREAELKAAEHHDAWLRAKAETENIRRRSADEVLKAQRFANENLARELLPVMDSLLAALADASSDVDNLRKGVDLTVKQLTAAFERGGIREVDPMGQKFDPNLHQAIGMVEADAEPNTVVSVLQKGYTIHDRVVRPAMVTVAKPR